MPRRKKVELPPSKFFTYPEIEVDGFVIEKGELIKIKDEWGLRFKLEGLTTNTETGSQWVDCFEMYRGKAGVLRAFKLERVKRIPKKRGKRRAKRGTSIPTP